MIMTCAKTMCARRMNVLRDLSSSILANRIYAEQTLRNLFSNSFFSSVLLILILGAVYMATLLPGVGYSGDTAKFQFVGRVLGTPHATGYTTYIILNYFFTTFFPIGSLAYKANLLSAIFSIVSCIFLFRVLNLLGVTKTVASITSLTFGFTSTLWSQSIVAEVYTLHILFISTVVYFFLKWNKTRENRDFFVASALYALSFGNHLMTIAFLPAIIFLVWAAEKGAFVDLRKIVWAVLCVVLGALQYSYLFWRFYDPHTSYLEMKTPNVETFLWYMTGAQFRSQMFSFSIAQILFERIPLFTSLFLREYLFLLPVAVLGVVRLKNKTINIFLLFSFLGNIFFAINYNIPDIPVYLLPNYFIVAIYLAAGLDLIKTAAVRNNIALKSILLISIPLISCAVNYVRVDQHNNVAVAKEIEAILETVGDNSIIISPNYTYSEYFWYYLIGEGFGNNVYVMHHFSTEAIKSYICENKSFYLPEQRMNAPIGSKVYCINPEHKSALEKAGFMLTEVRRNLYRVDVYEVE